MDAIISGQTGTAILIEGESVTSTHFDNLDQIVTRRPADIPYLIRDATDIVVLTNTNKDDAIAQLTMLWKQDRCLHLALILLDAGVDRADRLACAKCISNHLSIKPVWEFVANRLYSAPLPDVADLDGAITCAGPHSELGYLLDMLGEMQSHIRLCREAWDSLPDELCGGRDAKEAFRISAVKAGTFRAVVESMAASRPLRPEELPLKDDGSTSEKSSGVVTEWVKRIDEFRDPRSEQQPKARATMRWTFSKVPSPVVAIPSVEEPGFFWGSNRQIQGLRAILSHIGRSEAPVLIEGETGTGKEMIARELHSQSPRASKPFLRLNIAALPSELVETELFGYERGAFTGALHKKRGMLELADTGTILLDEIGYMESELQARLLRVLQDHEFQRIGGKDLIKVDVRVIAATHCDLEKSIAEGKFREDLYYRLNVIRLSIPPLRNRKDDLIPLAEFLIARHLGPSHPAPVITEQLRQAMMRYKWPGNVRELENFVRRFIILQDPTSMTEELHAKAAREPRPAHEGEKGDSLQEPERHILEQVTRAKQKAETDVILAALNTTQWNRKQAAALLKTDYRALLYKMKKLGIEGLSGGQPSRRRAAEEPSQ
jgi:DNA-binding NtrC family response regulator